MARIREEGGEWGGMGWGTEVSPDIVGTCVSGESPAAGGGRPGLPQEPPRYTNPCLASQGDRSPLGSLEGVRSTECWAGRRAWCAAVLVGVSASGRRGSEQGQASRAGGPLAALWALPGTVLSCDLGPAQPWQGEWLCREGSGSPTMLGAGFATVLPWGCSGIGKGEGRETPVLPAGPAPRGHPL